VRQDAEKARSSGGVRVRISLPPPPGALPPSASVPSVRLASPTRNAEAGPRQGASPAPPVREGADRIGRSPIRVSSMTSPEDLDHLACDVVTEDRSPISDAESPLRWPFASQLPDITLSGLCETLQGVDDPRLDLRIQLLDVSEGARGEYESLRLPGQRPSSRFASLRLRPSPRSSSASASSTADRSSSV